MNKKLAISQSRPFFDKDENLNKLFVTSDNTIFFKENLAQLWAKEQKDKTVTVIWRDEVKPPTQQPQKKRKAKKAKTSPI